MKSSTKIAIIVLVAALAVTTVAGTYLSNEEFQTPNFIAVLYGMASVCVSDADYVEIDSSPQILMTDTRGMSVIEEYMMLHGGYTKTDQLGATHVFENETHRITVDHDTKIFCVIWVIGDPQPKE